MSDTDLLRHEPAEVWRYECAATIAGPTAPKARAFIGDSYTAGGHSATKRRTTILAGNQGWVERADRTDRRH